MNLKIEKGQSVKLICCEPCKLHLYKDGKEYNVAHGHITTSTAEEEVIVDGFIGDSIIGKNGKLYPLASEFDSGFYSVLARIGEIQC